MSFDSIFDAFDEVSALTFIFWSRFYQFIANNPLIVFGLIVTIAVPACLSVFLFISDIHSDIEDVAGNGLSWYKYFHDKKIKKEKAEKAESFKRDKQKNLEIRRNAAYLQAQTFFKNNPSRMSITIDGFKFFQKGFENKNWSNRRRMSTSTRYFSGGSRTSTTVTDTKDITISDDLKSVTEAERG